MVGRRPQHAISKHLNHAIVLTTLATAPPNEYHQKEQGHGILTMPDLYVISVQKWIVSCLSCGVFCQIVSLQYLSRSSLHHLAGLPCRLFLSWSPSGDTWGPLVVFEAVDIPCPEPFHFPHIADYVYDLTQMLVLLVCAAASLFCASVHETFIGLSGCLERLAGWLVSLSRRNHQREALIHMKAWGYDEASIRNINYSE